jgi:Protein of unknown function (DUF2958)
VDLRRPVEAPRLYAQDGKGYEATVFAHYFVSGCDWLVTEYDPEDDLAFGWACLNGDRQNAELGYVSLAELETVRAPVVINGQRVNALRVEYEDGWPQMSLREAIAHLDKRSGLAG